MWNLQNFSAAHWREERCAKSSHVYSKSAALITYCYRITPSCSDGCSRQCIVPKVFLLSNKSINVENFQLSLGYNYIHINQCITNDEKDAEHLLAESLESRTGNPIKAICNCFHNILCIWLFFRGMFGLNQHIDQF